MQSASRAFNNDRRRGPDTNNYLRVCRATHNVTPHIATNRRFFRDIRTSVIATTAYTKSPLSRT
jgi:hypothetical protein